jgi:hypothetical protein
MSIRYAALNGRLEVLQLAREHGHPWNEYTCSDAAQNGHLHILKWAHENGCKWDEWTCAHAAKNGHLEVLQWAREHGCPWDSITCAWAANSNHIEILKWARQNGCDWEDWHRSKYQFNVKTHPMKNYVALKWLCENDELYLMTPARTWLKTIDSTLYDIFIDDICDLIKQYC